jgi:hypothetical protein
LLLLRHDLVHYVGQNGLKVGALGHRHHGARVILGSELAVQVGGNNGLADTSEPDNGQHAILLRWIFHPLLEPVHVLVHSYRVLGGDELEASLLVLGSIKSSSAAAAGTRSCSVSCGAVLGFGVVDVVPLSALTDLLRARLEVGDLAGDVTARPPRHHLVDTVDEEVAGDVAAEPAGVVDVVAGVIDAVFHVVGHVVNLLHPVLGPVVMLHLPEVAEEGLHGAELIGDVLQVTVDASDQSVLLGEEAPELAQVGLHRGLGGAHHQIHGGACLWWPCSPSAGAALGWAIWMCWMEESLMVVMYLPILYALTRGLSFF